jgi:hypothetical protein
VGYARADSAQPAYTGIIKRPTRKLGGSMDITDRESMQVEISMPFLEAA